MRYLVTGAAGFIGYYTARALLAAGREVVGIDSLNDYYRTDLKYERLAALESAAGDSAGSWEFRRGSLEDPGFLETVFEAGKFDRVIHLAAQAGVRYSQTNPRAYVSSNLEGFLNVIECCRQSGTGHLAFASSSSVYGMNRKAPFSETDRVDHPISLYAATKRANELMAHTYSHLYGIPMTGMRFFTVYGPMGRPDMAYFKFADAIMNDKPIEIYNNGDLMRDFTYVDDVVRAVLMIADKPAEADPGFDASDPLPDRSSARFRIYNIGNSKPERLERFISILEEALGKKAIREYLPMQPGDVYMTSSDTGALERDFGWRPSTGLEEGLGHFVEWYKERKPWLQ